MEVFMKWYHWFAGALMTWAFYALGQPSPLTDGAGLSEIFTEVVKVFEDSKGLSYQYKIASVLFVSVAIFKNSDLQPYWDRLGKAKPLVAPLLSLVAFLFMVQPFTLDTALAAITTGAAAGYFAQVLDALKVVPKVGGFFVFLSDFFSNFLKNKK